MELDRFRIEPGRKVRLSRLSTNDTDGVRGKAAAKRLLGRNVDALSEQLERLYIQDQYALLVIFQAMDGAGKDSTIKHVMSGVNPQGVQVTSFKVPSARELDHDYLWRSVVALPERGMLGIHNRSYYEEVLVAKVHPTIVDHQHLPPDLRKGDFWARRYRQINQFEQFLTENGTVVLKFFLHVSFEEQRQRFLERIETPRKNWKFSLQDVKERAFWNDYMKAYEEAIHRTSTDVAPWYVVPADHKWYMQLVVGEIIVRTLKQLKLGAPVLDDTRRLELKEGKRLLEAERRR